MPVRIEDEGRVVGRMVMRSQTGWSVVAAASGQRRGVEGVDIGPTIRARKAMCWPSGVLGGGAGVRDRRRSRSAGSGRPGAAITRSDIVRRVGDLHQSPCSRALPGPYRRRRASAHSPRRAARCDRSCRGLSGVRWRTDPSRGRLRALRPLAVLPGQMPLLRLQQPCPRRRRPRALAPRAARRARPFRGADAGPAGSTRSSSAAARPR